MRAKMVESLVILALLLPELAMAQEGVLPPTFTSDRPGFANTTGVAARGHLTAEMGVTGSFGDVPAGSLPDSSLRVGLFEWLEARVRGPSAAGVFETGNRRFGLGDPVVGFKAGGRLVEPLSISVDWEVSLPIGTDGFRSPEATFFADFNLDWRLWGPLTLTPNLVASVLAQVDEGTGETVRVFEGGGSLKLTWQILGVLGVYVQGYVLKSEVSDWRVAVGGGIFWQVSPEIQVDASFDAAVTEQGDDPTARIGTTILF